MTRLSRWIGALEVISGPVVTNEPIFVPHNDPFVVRFTVRPIAWLSVEKALPIHDEEVWSRLTFTRDLERNSTAWTGKVRGSLVRLDPVMGSSWLKS